MAPFRKTFSRPEKSGWKPAPSSSSEPMRPPTATWPSVGLMIPAIRRSSVDLPEPLRPTRPTASPGSTASDTSASAWTSAASVRPPSTNSSFRLRASFARTRKRRETPSTRIWPVFTPETVQPPHARTRPASTRDERRIGVRQLDPLEPEPELVALAAAASTSRSQRISRWSATKPIGQRTTSRTSLAASSFRCSRMSGPSHGSPVGDSLWNENVHSCDARALGDEARGLEQLVAVRVALVEDPRRAASAR